MNAIAEIDKAGRVIVPKKLRDALHLVPGTRLVLRQEGDSIVLHTESAPRGLYMKKGTLIFDAGPVPPSNAVDWIAEGRRERIGDVLRNVSKR